MTQRLSNPFPLFLNSRGALMDNGSIYIGVVNQDPQTSPINTFWDKALTLPAPQPLKTMGGAIVRNGSPASVWFSQDDYSIRVRDNDGNEVFYLANVNDDTTEFQPFSIELTKISLISTVAYGRSLLTLTNQAALRAATGIPDPLPLSGGTVTGNITRGGRGVHVYHNDATFTSGRIFVTAAGAADPTSLPGDIWLERS